MSRRKSQPAPGSAASRALHTFFDGLRAFRAVKPRIAPKGSPAARQIEAENGETPLSLGGILIRLLPVWVLIAAVLIMEPGLPLRALTGLFDGVGGPGGAPTPRQEPVFIVEAATNVAITAENPTPNWSLDIAPMFTPEVQHWKDSIGRWSLTYRIKPNLIAALMQIESCGNPQVVSGADARGLFQVTPGNFAAGDNSFDPETNAHVGLSLFAQSLAGANGDIGLAFAAYNGGPVIFTMSPSEWPKETQTYQYWGSGIVGDAELNLSQSPSLQEWLDSGGSDLCRAAHQALGMP
jgi:hypothetical protein